jgi:hypothetical protein
LSSENATSAKGFGTSQKLDGIYSARYGFTAGNRQTYLAARIGNTFGPKSVRFRLVLVRVRGLFALMCNSLNWGFERYGDLSTVTPAEAAQMPYPQHLPASRTTAYE